MNTFPLDSSVPSFEQPLRRRQNDFTDAVQAIQPRLWSRLLSLAWSMNLGQETARDVLQNTYLKVWRNWDRVCYDRNAPGKVFAYFARAALRLMLDECAARKRRGRFFRVLSTDATGRDPLDNLPGRDPSPEQIAIRNETQARIDGAFAGLSKEMQEAWMMTESMSLGEAASRLGLTPGGVGAFRHRIRNRLRQALRN
jgi:RNA polymerase sigma factor (sigma-70 family)